LRTPFVKLNSDFCGSANIQCHTSISNDRIKALNSEFPTSMIWHDQSQREDKLHQKQSLGDCITGIRVRHICTDAHRFRSRIKRTRV